MSRTREWYRDSVVTIDEGFSVHALYFSWKVFELGYLVLKMWTRRRIMDTLRRRLWIYLSFAECYHLINLAFSFENKKGCYLFIYFSFFIFYILYFVIYCFSIIVFRCDFHCIWEKRLKYSISEKEVKISRSNCIFPLLTIGSSQFPFIYKIERCSSLCIENMQITPPFNFMLNLSQNNIIFL